MIIALLAQESSIFGKICCVYIFFQGICNVGYKVLLKVCLCGKIYLTIVLQGGVAFHFFYRMEVMLMKKYDFQDLMAFGVFILALLTFIFQFNK